MAERSIQINILSSDRSYWIVSDEMLNHWLARGGHCSCGAVYNPSPDNIAHHVATAVVDRLRREEDEEAGAN